MMSRSLFVLAALVLAGEAKTLLPCTNAHGECSPKSDSGRPSAGGLPGTLPFVSAASSPGTSGPNDRFGRLAETTAGWTDLKKSHFVRFHEYLVLHVATTIPEYKVQPRTLSWGCTDKLIDFHGNEHTVKSCMALVFVYRCGKCKSAGQEEIIGKMLLEGWEPVHCAGYFDLDNTVASHEHRFSMFYQEFAPTPTSATTRTLVVEQETEFMFWGQIHRDNTMCADQGNEDLCTKHSTEDCYWDDVDSACKPKMCPPLVGNPWAVGPGVPQCQTCVHDEAHLLVQ